MSPQPKPPDAGELIETVVEKLVPGGDGLARAGGKVLFIPFALPGERVLVRLTEVKRDYARAVVVEIRESSPERMAPPCPAFGRCGGCDWQHIDPEAQARHKVALAEDALRRVGGIAFPGLRIETGNPWRYRNRIQIHRDAAGNAGFLARGSRDLAPLRDCPVSRPAFAPLFAPRTPFPGDASPAGGAEANRFAAWSHPLPEGGDCLISAEGGGAGDIAVPLLGKTLRFDLRCFFQSNLEMTARLVPYALEGIAGNLALDLYCGVGLFGAFLADRFRRVLAVEENASALAFARRNIGDTHVFLRGRVEDLLRDPRGPLASSRPDAAVVDPPRGGLDRAVIDFLAAKRPPRLSYVSCNPVTLARDLKILLLAGFRLGDLRLFDFYPQTAHVEAVAKLEWAAGGR